MPNLTKRAWLQHFGAIATLPLLAAACGQTAATGNTANTGSTGSTGNAAKSAAAAPTTAAKTNTAPAQTAQQQKITYWGSFSGSNGKAETEVVNMFNTSQSTVAVDYQPQGSYEETANKLSQAIAGRTAPEVSLLSDVWWFKFYLDKVILPLDDLMKSQNVDAKDYIDPLYQDGVRNGKVYWLPFARSTPIFFYNKDAFQKAGLPDRGPKNWTEFTTDFVPKLKPLSPSEVLAHPGSTSYVAWIFQCVDWEFGGQYSDKDFNITVAEPKSVQAGEFYRASVADGWAQYAKDQDGDFRSGQALTLMGSTAGLAGHEAAAKFQVGTAFMPDGPAGFGCCTGGSGMSILSNTSGDKQVAAMKFIDFATGPKATTFWSQNTGYMPVRKSAVTSADMKAFFDKHPNFKTVVDQLPKTRPQDAARVFIPNGDQIIGKALERILANGEHADVVFNELADTLKKEADPVIRKMKALGS